MGKSLQDQLLSLGLAKEKPARKPAGKKAGHKRGKPTAGKGSRENRQAGSRPGSGKQDIDLSKAYALRRADEKREAEQAKIKKQEEDRRRRQLNKQLTEIVNQHRLNDPEAEIGRNFLFKGRIRKINLTAGQLERLNKGELGVVYLRGRYHLLAAEQVEAVRALSPEHVPDLGGADDGDEEFPVPDDLVW